MIDGLKIDANRTRMYYEKGYWGTDTLYDVWSRQSTLHANRPYVKDDTGTAFTYAQVDQLASKLATWLKSIGVRNGDIVSFQVPKWAEFAVIYVACLKVGAVMHPWPSISMATIWSMRLAKRNPPCSCAPPSITSAITSSSSIRLKTSCRT